MSAVHGKNTYVAFDDATGTLQPISSFFKSAAPTRSVDMAETSAFTQTAKTYAVGMNDETIDIQGHFDVALHTQVVALMAALDAGTLASATVVVGPAGSATGMPKTQRECFIKSYVYTATNSDIVQVTISFQRTGPNSDSVFP